MHTDPTDTTKTNDDCAARAAREHREHRVLDAEADADTRWREATGDSYAWVIETEVRRGG